MRNTNFNRIAVSIASCMLVASAWAQRAGQNVSVQYGKVAAARQIDLKSAAPSGAVVGGTLGLISGSGKSSAKKARNVVIGAAAGAAVAGSAQGSTTGMLYDVDLGAQGKMQIVSDQREIRIGDCVAVEKAGETANVRRVSEAYCDKANAAAVSAVAAHSSAEAEACLQAKQQLVDATATAEADLAARKIALLCND